MKSASVPPALLAGAAREGATAGVRATPRLEEVHVRDVYDRVATQWAGTRYRAWPEVERFARESVRRGDAVVEVGCGNGKNLRAVLGAGATVLASDTSLPLCEIAAQQAPPGSRSDVAAADVCDLPYRSGAFDALLCVAVLHHLSTPERRLRAVQECARVCAVGARLFFQAWAAEQDDGVSGHAFASQDVFVPFHQRTHVPGFDAAALLPERADASVGHGVLAEEKRAVVFQRYCHVFARGELDALVQAVPGLRVTRSFKDAGNCAFSRRDRARGPSTHARACDAGDRDGRREARGGGGAGASRGVSVSSGSSSGKRRSRDQC